MSRPATKAGRLVRRTRPGRGTLNVIAGLLLTSAIVRLGHGTSQALAGQSTAEPAREAALTEHAAPESCVAPDMAAMLAAFQARETRLAEREEKLRMRMQALNLADGEIATRLAALKQAEEDLRATLALADSAAENDLTRLTTVYENMKPKDAAALFEAMDPQFSAGFLGRMRPEAAAAIMAGLSPETAYTISAIVAGRNTGVPKE